jgi:hypothetical protein
MHKNGKGIIFDWSDEIKANQGIAINITLV